MVFVLCMENIEKVKYSTPLVYKMPRDNVSEKEIIELAREFAGRFSHLSEETHLRIVRVGYYGNRMPKASFLEWYAKTIPLLKPEMVKNPEDISYLLMHDTFLVCEAGYKPLCEILKQTA